MTVTSNIRVVLIDDHPMLRDGVSLTLSSASNIDVVAQGENAQDAIHLSQTQLPDIILLDISMPGGVKMSGWPVAWRRATFLTNTMAIDRSPAEAISIDRQAPVQLKV